MRTTILVVLVLVLLVVSAIGTRFSSSPIFPATAMTLAPIWMMALAPVTPKKSLAKKTVIEKAGEFVLLVVLSAITVVLGLNSGAVWMVMVGSVGMIVFCIAATVLMFGSRSSKSSCEGSVS